MLNEKLLCSWEIAVYMSVVSYPVEMLEEEFFSWFLAATCKEALIPARGV